MGVTTDGAGGGGVRSVTFDGGRRVSYSVFGVSDGTPVVFLHGTPGSRRLGSLFGVDAERTGATVVAPDRPGFGRSPPWRARTLEDTASFLGAVLDGEGIETAHFVGFSGGGPHALSMAATRPSRVESVALASTAVPPSLEPRPPRLRRLVEVLAAWTPRLLGASFGLQASVAAYAPPAFVLSQYTTDPDAIPDDVAETVKRDFLEGFESGSRGAVTEFSVLSDPWAAMLEDVACPVRIWHGRDDATVPLDGVRRLDERLDQSELTVLEGADHLTTLLRCRTAVLDWCTPAPSIRSTATDSGS